MVAILSRPQCVNKVNTVKTAITQRCAPYTRHKHPIHFVRYVEIAGGLRGAAMRAIWEAMLACKVARKASHKTVSYDHPPRHPCPQLRTAVCGWIKELNGRVSARGKWRLKEMIVDFRRADLGCVQWCQIGLGKGAGVDHFRSKRSLLQLPLYPIGEVFPKRVSNLPC